MSRVEGYKIYIGDLPRDASEKEIERAFARFGPVTNVWVARNPPGFAFVHMEDKRDADDAIHDLDGAMLCGTRVRVEMSTGKTKSKPWMQDRERDRGRDRYGSPRRRSPRYSPMRSRGSPRYSPQRRYRSRSRSPGYNRRRSYSRSPR